MNHLRRFGLILCCLVILYPATGCLNNSDCPLPPPFCGGSFPLNTQYTTPYGPPWANVVTSNSDWITCFGPYALCYYANCVPSPDSGGTVADCPCFEWFGTNFVDINSILNEDVYEETVAFCNSNPGLCQQPNQAPVCHSLQSGDFMEGADRFSTFSFYRASKEPIGTTDCTSQPDLYAGCMTAPCFDPTVPGEDPNTTVIECQCPTFYGPFQLGQDNLSCDDGAMIYSAAYNTNPPSPASPCDTVQGCVPDAPEDSCGCGLFVPGTTVLPPNSGVDCAVVCQEYNDCQRQDTIQLGYTCDATICTSDEQNLVLDACFGLQNCDLSEVFKAESAAQCSCCASQLCGCTPNALTNQQITNLNAEQRSDGETPQCDINGTLCGS